MHTTLMLDKNTWDIFLDENGNIATTTDAYAIAQNVSNAVRLFTNDAYFNQQDGIPHFNIELGNIPSEALLRTKITERAKSVAGVLDAETTVTTFNNRTLEGRIIITTDNGVIVYVTV